ncbi:MAG: glycine cleavage system aminomethyltransferase GcvT [Pseudonocardiaceae bacterium]
MSTSLRRGPLHAFHVDNGATLGAFGGWEMPIYHTSVIAEHTAVREAVGVFDVTHLGKLSVTGSAAAELVNSCLTADLAKIGPGQAQYTLCCAADGGVVDDLIAYLVGPDEVFCVPNAANTGEVGRRLSAAAPPGVRVVDLHDDYAVIAVQGPHCAEALATVGLPSDIDYLAFADAQHDGVPVRVGRTGYTGERGYELLAPWGHAVALWEALLAAIGPLGGRVCGLGARDTLRTEMGYPLHGQDLGPEITPVQGGVSWAVGWDKPTFWGRDVLLAERERGPFRRLRGLRASGRGVPRPQMAVRSPAGVLLGKTTSGTFSVTLRTGIALALLDPAVQPGEVVEIDIRGRALSCEVVKPPFVPSRVR